MAVTPTCAEPLTDRSRLVGLEMRPKTNTLTAGFFGHKSDVLLGNHRVDQQSRAFQFIQQGHDNLGTGIGF